MHRLFREFRSRSKTLSRGLITLKLDRIDVIHAGRRAFRLDDKVRAVETVRSRGGDDEDEDANSAFCRVEPASALRHRPLHHRVTERFRVVPMQGLLEALKPLA